MNERARRASVPGPLGRLKWRLTLSYALVALATIIMLAWWTLIAVTLYQGRVDPTRPWWATFAEQVIPVVWAILPAMALLIVPALALSTTFGFLSARWLDARLAHLRAATDAWERGDFGIKVQDPAPDEIGAFGHALNRMAERLERLLRARQELAAIDERQRLARDLHDSVKQHLTATALQLAAARALVERDPAAAAARLDAAEDLAHAAQDELSGVIFALRPAALGSQGLGAALRDYLAQWSQRSGIAAQVRVPDDLPVVPALEPALFRFAQEALANVARHSRATEALVELGHGDSELTLSIRDNGCGFDPAAVRSGSGLRNMRERIAQAGGTLAVESQPGRGTQVTARMPLGTRVRPEDSP